MERPKREDLLEAVTRVLVEEGGQATMARLYFRLHSRFNIPFYEFAEEVKRSGRFVVVCPTGWENDLVALKAPEAESRLEGRVERRVEPLKVNCSPCRRCECEE